MDAFQIVSLLLLVGLLVIIIFTFKKHMKQFRIIEEKRDVNNKRLAELINESLEIQTKEELRHYIDEFEKMGNIRPRPNLHDMGVLVGILQCKKHDIKKLENQQS